MDIETFKARLLELEAMYKQQCEDINLVIIAREEKIKNLKASLPAPKAGESPEELKAKLEALEAQVKSMQLLSEIPKN